MKRIYLVIAALAIVGCKKSPFDRTENATGPAALAGFSSGNFALFRDELRTGGGAFLYPGGDNQVPLPRARVVPAPASKESPQDESAQVDLFAD